ncbi:unnamed protein product [Strongylus vulgaris]|uniref:Uncharacterized protein n=1 Tax=Strongylus vulgaris TaxID=40348 RepID=A0A3P7J5Z7_STRVU|nr:unnamed protein product [Strongylus vulgaris]
MTRNQKSMAEIGRGIDIGIQIVKEADRRRGSELKIGREADQEIERRVEVVLATRPEIESEADLVIDAGDRYAQGAQRNFDPFSPSIYVLLC